MSCTSRRGGRSRVSVDSERKIWWGQPKMNEHICTDTDQLPGSQREGGGKETGDSKVLGPGDRESSDFACRDLRPIIFEDSGLCRLLGC